MIQKQVYVSNTGIINQDCNVTNLFVDFSGHGHDIVVISNITNKKVDRGVPTFGQILHGFLANRDIDIANYYSGPCGGIGKSQFATNALSTASYLKIFIKLDKLDKKILFTHQYYLVSDRFQRSAENLVINRSKSVEN